MTDPSRLDDLIRTLLVRYAEITPGGLVLHKGHTPLREVPCLFLHTSPARTLYRDRQPVCRSLDGIRGRGGKECAPCGDRDSCTPQVLLDVEIDRRSYRLLLAYTSARNFLLFADGLARAGRKLQGMTFTMRILDRGRWGELRFDLPT
jgi:hypothetical protein